MTDQEDTNQRLQRAFELFEAGNLIEAEQAYESCLSAVEKESAPYETAIHWLGFVKSDLQKFDEARAIYEELRHLAQKQGNFQNEQIAIHQMGMVERMAGQYDKAFHLFEEEYHALQTYNPEFALGFAANYYEKGYICLLQGELSRAEEFMEKSLLYAETSGDLVSRGCALRGLGEIAAAGRHAEAAAEYYIEAKEAFEQAGDQIGMQEIDELQKKLK